MKKFLTQVDFENKKVLVRVDFNVPMKGTKITSNARIAASMPTINAIFKQNPEKLILFSHLGRVKTEADKAKKSLRPVAKELAILSRRKVVFCRQTRGSELKEKIAKLGRGEILLVENTRFEDLNNQAESKNSSALGKYWASLGDVFVNDAFGTVHRAHASNVGIASNIKESCIGLLVQEELKMLSRAVYHPERPFVAIIGGAKVSEKINVINNLINKVDYLLIGGGMAYTFTKAQMIGIGNSIFEEDKVGLAKEYLKKYSHKIILPIDYALSSTFKNEYPKYNLENTLEIPAGFMGLDIGPKTIDLFGKILKGARTVIWNGPMGVTEFSFYRKGTEAIANIIASQENCFSIIGGGDSAAAIYELGLEKNFTHISTGGGASLAFFEGAALPGVDSIQEQASSFVESASTNNNSNKPKNASANEQKIVSRPLSNSISSLSASDINKNKLTINREKEKTNGEKLVSNHLDSIPTSSLSGTNANKNNFKINKQTSNISEKKITVESENKNSETNATKLNTAKVNSEKAATIKENILKPDNIATKATINDKNLETESKIAKTHGAPVSSAINTKHALNVKSPLSLKNETKNEAGISAEKPMAKIPTKTSWAQRFFGRFKTKTTTTNNIAIENPKSMPHPNKSLPIDETKVIDTTKFTSDINKKIAKEPVSPFKKTELELRTKADSSEVKKPAVRSTKVLEIEKNTVIKEANNSKKNNDITTSNIKKPASSNEKNLKTQTSAISKEADKSKK